MSVFSRITDFPTSERSYGHSFLDSGAHSLYVKYVIKLNQGYGFFETDEFWKYVDSYARYVKKHKEGIDYYANVDVIFKPELSWKVLKYLEDAHGLNPVPVVHFGTDLKWLRKHMDEGYSYIGLGGLGQTVTKTDYFEWGDRVFSYICPKPSRLPIVKTHGFAMTSYDLLIRYPWYSVDSTSWIKTGAFGSILIPHRRKGSYVFHINPRQIIVSSSSPNSNNNVRNQNGGDFGQHRKLVLDWLDHIGVPFGKNDSSGNVVEWGVINQNTARAVANMRFFRLLCNYLPKWPWPLSIRDKKGLLH